MRPSPRCESPERDDEEKSEMKTLMACVASVIMLMLVSGTPLSGQQQVPPTFPGERGIVARGLPIAPFLEGWYGNSDGTYTLSFGFFNRNQEEELIVPLGEDNFIEPAEYDGVQPTVFPAGRGTGVFSVTVPGDFARNDGRVVWTLRTAGETQSVPGKVGVHEYELFYGPMGMGSFAPVLKVEENGPELWGVMSYAGDPHEMSEGSEANKTPTGSILNPVRLTAAVGVPLALTVWVADRVDPEGERLVEFPDVDLGVTWFTHQGPAAATFADDEPEPDENGKATTTVTFPEPGRYMLRVRSDNFNPVDSSPGDQCCWTNGYFEVTVSR